MPSVDVVDETFLAVPPEVVAAAPFVAPILVGVADTVRRTFAPTLLAKVLDPSAASQTGRTLAPMLIYIMMALVLFARPSGLFPKKGAA